MSKRSTLVLMMVCCLILLMNITSLAATTEITFLGSWGAEYRLQSLAGILAGFERENPSIKVTVVNVAGWPASEEKAKVMIAGGTPPDLIYMGETGGVTAFAASGLLNPLDSYILGQGSGVNLNDFIPSVLEMGKYKGKIYGLPIDSLTSVLYYNDDLMAKAGLRSLVTTQADLLKTADKLKALTDTPIGMNNLASMFRFSVFLYPNGGQYFSNDLKENFFTSSAMRDTANYVASALQQKRLVYNNSNQWFQGQVGLTEAQPIHVSNTENQGVSYSTSASKFPKGTSGQAVYGWGHYLSIPTTAKNKDAAWKLAQYLMRVPVSETWHREMRFMPAQISVLRTTSYYRDHPIWRVFFDQLQDSLPLPVTPRYQDIDAIFVREIQPAFDGKVAVESALEKIKAGVQAILAEIK